MAPRRSPVRSIVVALALAGILTVGAARALATETISTDAVWWNSLDESQQDLAVLASMEAFWEGFGAGTATQESYDTLSTSGGHKVRESLRPPIPRVEFSKTIGTYRHEITDFYVNHPEASTETIGGILWCLSDEPLLSCDEIAKDAAITRGR